MGRVALVTDDVDLEGRVFQGLGPDRFVWLVTTHQSLVVAEPAIVVAELVQTGADVVILGPKMDTLNALTVAELLDQAHPEITCILVADPTAELLELAIQAGVRRVVPLDADADAMRVAIESALAIADRRREAMVIDIRERAPEDVTEPARTGRVITVIAPKGGSGKTTVATNLAAGLATLVPDGVALVDLDLQFGDVADALRIAPDHTLGDVRGRADQLDSAELKLLLARHETSGLHVLCSPEDPAVAEEVRTADIAAAIDVLAADMPFVVIDTAAGVDDATLTAIDRSTDLVLLASNDVPSIRNLRKLVNALDRIGMTKPYRHLVLNRAGTKVDIHQRDVETTLGMPVAVAIPSARGITLSVNHGEPIVMNGPKNALARPFLDLVGRFTDVPAARAGGFSIFRRSAR